MKGTLALITVLVSLTAPAFAGAAVSSAANGGGGGGSGAGASHAGGGGGSSGGSGHAGPSVGSASHAAASHATAARVIATHVTAGRLTNVKMATRAPVDAVKPKPPKPKLPPVPVLTRYRGSVTDSSWRTANFYCADRDYSLGVLTDVCTRSSKSSDKGG